MTQQLIVNNLVFIITITTLKIFRNNLLTRQTFLVYRKITSKHFTDPIVLVSADVWTQLTKICTTGDPYYTPARYFNYVYVILRGIMWTPCAPGEILRKTNLTYGNSIWLTLGVSRACADAIFVCACAGSFLKLYLIFLSLFTSPFVNYNGFNHYIDIGS